MGMMLDNLCPCPPYTLLPYLVLVYICISAFVKNAIFYSLAVTWAWVTAKMYERMKISKTVKKKNSAFKIAWARLVF